jgi:hypothetical protein
MIDDLKYKDPFAVSKRRMRGKNVELGWEI